MAGGIIGNGVKGIILFWVVVSLVSGHSQAQGRRISREEYWQLKRHLKLINKPGIKSIKTRGGEIFDCVDVNKQPAFDHPLLQNHTIQMEPSFYPKLIKKEVSSDRVLHASIEGGGCPLGTVPIRRTQMKDLLRVPHPSNYGKKYPMKYSNVQQFVVLKTWDGEYYGSKAELNVWRPNTPNDQRSTSQFYINNGFRNPVLNVIHGGWEVHPQLFGNNETHLFGYWTMAMRVRVATIFFCPGFVQVSTAVPIGTPISPISTYNGEQYYIIVQAVLDREHKNWWLLYGMNNEKVGYWPASIFTYLPDRATSVAWGGFVEYKSNAPNGGPYMGSGHYPDEGFRKASFIRNIEIIDSSDFKALPDSAYIKTSSGCYEGIEGGDAGKEGGRYIFLGALVTVD